MKEPKINEAVIQYCGTPMKVACDRNCKKAWGINNRPTVPLSDDEDDFAWKADSELGNAPKDPGTYEGGHAKPLSPNEFPNKWCVRECERCAHSKMGRENRALELPSFEQRVFNQPEKHR